MFIELSAFSAIVIGGWVSYDGYTPEVSFAADCTTGERIRYGEIIPIPANLNEKQTEVIVQSFLGSTYSASTHQYIPGNAADEWLYEGTVENVIYTGIVVRNKHYLQIAIYIEGGSVQTIVCNSKNLKQKERSIHRKVVEWKRNFDTRMEVELDAASKSPKIINPEMLGEHPSQAATGGSRNETVTELLRLSELREEGLITDEEFERLKNMLLENSEANQR